MSQYRVTIICGKNCGAEISANCTRINTGSAVVNELARNNGWRWVGMYRDRNWQCAECVGKLSE